MLWFISWHGVGALCVIGIVLLGKKMLKQEHAASLSKCICSFFIGLFFGGLGVVAIFLLFLIGDDFMGVLLDVPDLLRLYLVTLYLLFGGFCGGKLGAFLLKKYLPSSIIRPSALIAALLFALQPIGYGWLHNLGIVS